jgi:hypothetical protein
VNGDGRKACQRQKKLFTRPETIADTLEQSRVLARAKTVVELLESNLRLVELALCPLVAVQVDPHWEKGVGVGLYERGPPLGIERIEIEIEMVDHCHLAPPLVLRAPPVLGALLLPRAPHRRLLLSDTGENDTRLVLIGGDLEVGTNELLLRLALFEVDDRNVIDLGETVEGLDVGVTELAEGC